MKTSRTSYYFILFITIITHQTLAIQRTPTTTTTTTTIYTEFIKTSCKTTTYPDLCYNSLLTHAPVIQTNPKLLASTALSVTLDTAVTTSDAVSRMMMSSKEGRKKTMILLPREAGAMRDCLEVLSDAIAELQSSIKEMGEIVTTNESNNDNYRMLINDVQTWVSAALTDENTCMEGFGGKVMDGSVIKSIIRGKIEIICHLTSNSLALINNFATLHG